MITILEAREVKKKKNCLVGIVWSFLHTHHPQLWVVVVGLTGHDEVKSWLIHPNSRDMVE